MSKTKSAGKSASSLAVATVDSSTPELLKAVEEKLKSMAFIQDTPYKTSGDLQMSGFANIKQETKIDNLIRAISSIEAREKAYNASSERLSKKVDLGSFAVFTHAGYTLEEWDADVLLRIQIINQKETHDELLAIKEGLSKFLSETDQKNMLLERLNKIVVS